jgi:hypothetical protein
LLQDEAKAIVIQMKIPTCFWDKLLAVVCYKFNKTGQFTVGDFTPAEFYEEGLSPRPGEDFHRPDNSNLKIIGSRCIALINENERTRGEKLHTRGAKALFLGYSGKRNYIVWIIKGSRFLGKPHMITHESVGNVTEVPDPRDIVRSLLSHVQRRLRYRPKPTKGWIKNRDYNVIDDYVTDPKSKQIVRRRGRPRKRKRELCVLEAPEETPEMTMFLQLFQQEGEIEGETEGVSESEAATAGISLLKTLPIGRLDHMLNVAGVCLADYATFYGFEDAMRLVAMVYPDEPT